MISKCFTLLIAAIATASSGQAFASSSAWFEAEGGRVRLVTTGAPDAEGRLKGVLQIDLKPGWKTYWRDPGGSGVPPSIDISGNPMLMSAILEFPTPEYHVDEVSTWAGYDSSVGLPITFHTRGGAKPGVIEAATFLGICETICVPVQAKLSVDTDAGADDLADAATVASALAALPGPATPEVGARIVEKTDKSVTLEVASPADAAKSELFLSGGEGYMFGPLKRSGSDGRRWQAEIITRPKQRPPNEGLHYTLATPGGAVSGLLPYF